MIKKTTTEDMFKTEAKHIAFTINNQGTKYTGYGDEVATKLWPELKKICTHEIGSVISKTIGDKTYHALVCHTLEQGWKGNQADIIKQCFDAIPANGEIIATVALGTRFTERMLGADFNQIIYGMHNSEQQIVIHTAYTLDDIMKIYERVKKENPQKRKIY